VELRIGGSAVVLRKLTFLVFIVLTGTFLPSTCAFASPRRKVSSKVACRQVLDRISPDKDLSWVKAQFSALPENRFFKAQDLDETPSFRRLPEDLKKKLTTPDKNGMITVDKALRKGLEDWTAKMVRERISNLEKAPQGLRQLDLWVHDKNGPDGSFAIRQLIKPEIGFFGVGHGKEGGDLHAIYPLTVNHKPILKVEMDVDKIIETYAKLPGVKNSKYIFYKTCSGGLSGLTSESDAARLARGTGVPVIAPMGILYNEGKVITEGKGQREWETHVSTEPGQPALPKNKAYKIFTPDGKQQSLTFKKMVDLIIRADLKSRVSYGF
jgi:hypothetical protein